MKKDKINIYLATKRIIDIVGALLYLILLSPLFLFLIISIKIGSPGPIFLRQQRVGKDGRLFTLYKFRTMKSAEDRSQQKFLRNIINSHLELDERAIIFKLTDDPRLTKIGRFLRLTSLDELPQLINVLMGDMSLVGPRPALPYEANLYEEWHKERLKCKAGLVGLWGVSGRNRLTFDEMVQLDIEYQRNMSLWLDFKICLLTIPQVLKGRNY